MMLTWQLEWSATVIGRLRLPVSVTWHLAVISDGDVVYVVVSGGDMAYAVVSGGDMAFGARCRR